eukprot:COSAG02_NODE_350_length_24063_cov_47.131447_24_plen_226_part_01
MPLVRITCDHRVSQSAHPSASPTGMPKYVLDSPGMRALCPVGCASTTPRARLGAASPSPRARPPPPASFARAGRCSDGQRADHSAQQVQAWPAMCDTSIPCSPHGGNVDFYLTNQLIHIRGLGPQIGLTVAEKCRILYCPPPRNLLKGTHSSSFVRYVACRAEPPSRGPLGLALPSSDCASYVSASLLQQSVVESVIRASAHQSSRCSDTLGHRQHAKQRPVLKPH